MRSVLHGAEVLAERALGGSALGLKCRGCWCSRLFHRRDGMDDITNCERRVLKVRVCCCDTKARNVPRARRLIGDKRR